MIADTCDQPTLVQRKGKETEAVAGKTETLYSPADFEIAVVIDENCGPEMPLESAEASESELGESAGTDDTNVGHRWTRIVAYWLLPAIVMLLGAAAGFLSYRDHSASAADHARAASVKAASESTLALLSYQPDTADKTLNDARDRLTGTFRDAYTSLIHDVVIPGAKQKHITSVATVPAAASISATGQHAEVLVFVNQSVIVGSDAPTATTSCVKVGLDKVGDRWLISQFDPV